MTGIDAFFWTVGCIVVLALGIMSTIVVISFPLAWAARHMWERLTCVYEIYVLNWWMETIKRSGRTIPTKENVDNLYKELEND